MSQRTHSAVNAARPKLLAIGAAVVLVSGLATGTAQAAPPDASTAGQAAPVQGVHVFDDTGFRGPNAWLNGTVSVCYYVGAGWNDTINSARTESGRVVELWDNVGCSGGAIVVDRSGYGAIGNWVSAYRIR